MYIETSTGRPVVAMQFDGSRKMQLKYHITAAPIMAKVMGLPGFTTEAGTPCDAGDWIVGGRTIMSASEFNRRYRVAE